MPKQFNTTDYLTIDASFLFVAALTEGDNEPDKHNVILSSAASANAVSLSVSALSAPLWEGMQLRYSASTATVAADAIATATSINIEPLPNALSNAASVSVYKVSPVYCWKQFNETGSEASLDLTNSNSGEWNESIILGRGGSLALTVAELVASNPGLNILKTASLKTKGKATVYVEFIDDLGKGIKGFFNVGGRNQSRVPRQAVDFSCTLTLTGRLYSLDENILLA